MPSRSIFLLSHRICLPSSYPLPSPDYVLCIAISLNLLSYISRLLWGFILPSPKCPFSSYRLYHSSTSQSNLFPSRSVRYGFTQYCMYSVVNMVNALCLNDPLCITRISSVPEDTNSTSGGKKREVNVGTRHASRRIVLAPRFVRRSCRLVHLDPSLLAPLRLYLVLGILGRLVERESRYRLLASFRMSLSYH